MAINFPDSPSVNDTHTVGDKTWTWDGTAWNVVVGGIPTTIDTLTINQDAEVDGILTANHIHGNIAGSVYLHVKNTSGSEIAAGTPVYATGSVGASGATEVSPSDASTAATMPALGITQSTLAVNAEGHATVLGVLGSQNTGSYTVNDSLYVAPGGGLTTTRPTAATDLVQKIARVVRADASTGELLVLGAGRTNDVPNEISILGDLTVDTDTLYVDSTNDRVGIGTTTPAEELDVVGDVQVSGRLGIGSGISAELDIKGASNPEIRLQSTDSSDPFLYFGDQVDAVRGGIGMDTSANALQLRGYNNSTRLTIDSSGNVGINDTTPSYTLDVNGDINTTGALRTDGKKTGLVLLTSGDVSSGGPITFTSLFSSEFDNYVVYISELTCTGQNAIYYRTASGGSWNTSSVYSNQRIYGQTTSIGAQRFSSTYAQFGYAGARESNYEITFFSPYLSTQTAVISRGAYSDNTNAGYIEFHHSYVDNTTSYDGFVFDEVTGSASISCRYEVYGIPK